MGSQVTSRPLEALRQPQRLPGVPRSGGPGPRGVEAATAGCCPTTRNGPSRARRSWTARTCMSPCAKATCGRRRTWPASTSQTGRRRWRTMVCAAETPGGGQSDEITHNLLTLEQGTLYYNTNLGAVAAISARDGRLQWVTLYPRAKKASPDGQDQAHGPFLSRFESLHLLSRPAAGGAGRLRIDLRARCRQRRDDLGKPIARGRRAPAGRGTRQLAGQRRFAVVDRRASAAKSSRHWPDTTPLGYGRGILMGDQVVWPTRDALYVFDQEVQPAQSVAARSDSAGPGPRRDWRKSGREPRDCC